MITKRSDFSFFPTLVDDIFRDFSNASDTLPAVNIKEDDTAFTVEVAIPGMNKEDININLENNVLTISSEQQSEHKDSKENYTRREYSYRSFKRSFNLPKTKVNSEAITANYKNGELMIVIPKVEKVEPKSKMIEIK